MTVKNMKMSGKLLRDLLGLLFVSLGLLFTQQAWAAQYARPNSTIAIGNFTAVNAASLHEAVDEEIIDENDSALSPESGNAFLELGLGVA